MDPSLDAGSEDEGEFESQEESAEMGVGQDGGSENASLMQQPQLGHWMSEVSHSCNKLTRRLHARTGSNCHPLARRGGRVHTSV